MYGPFAELATDAAHDMDELCAHPSDAALSNARQGFQATALYWSLVEPIRFGPVAKQNRLERILYWPDRKGIGLKQVQAALAAEDPSATDPKKLAGKSVALQGLGALEFILFGTGADVLSTGVKPYRCRFGAAIAHNLASMATDIDKEWAEPKGFAYQWAHPGPDNPLYRTDEEAVTELINIFVHGLEMIRDVRLNGFLGDQPEKDKPRQAIFWRSNITLFSLSLNIMGLQSLFETSGLADRLTGENQYIGNSIMFEFANALKAFEDLGLDRPLVDLLNDKDARAKLAYVRIVTSSLSDLFGTKLTAALGLTAGFSSLDGD